MLGAASWEGSLGRLGLTNDEARAYLALLSRGRLTARELCAATGITRGRIYEVARGLMEKGAALEAASRVRTFEPIAPRIALANLLEKRRREVVELESAAEELAYSLSAELSSEPAPASFVESLRHRASIAQRFLELQDDAEREILLFTRPPYYSTDNLGENEGEFRALHRDVAVRCVYESSVLEVQDELGAVSAYMGAGEQARHVPSLPTKLAIFDRSIAMLQITEPVDPSNFITLVFRHPGLSDLLVFAFEQVWQRAAPIARTETGESTGAVV